MSAATTNRTDRTQQLVRELERLPAAPTAAMRILWIADDADSSADDLGAVGAYIAPVEIKDGGKIRPGNLREQIRSKGLTIDLPVPA